MGGREGRGERERAERGRTEGGRVGERERKGDCKFLSQRSEVAVSRETVATTGEIYHSS